MNKHGALIWETTFYGDHNSTNTLSGDTRQVVAGTVVEVYLEEERRLLVRCYSWDQWWWAWVPPDKIKENS